MSLLPNNVGKTVQTVQTDTLPVQALQQYYNSVEFTQLNFNQILTGRQVLFKTLKSNVYKVGINSLSNRLYYINDQIPLNLLNASISTFKIKCKEMNLNVKLLFYF